MKKLAGVLVLAVALWGLAFAEQGGAPKFSIGLDSPTFAWVSADEQGGITSLIGFNVGLGFSYRSYFEPLMPRQGSVYWEAGTILLLDPYVGAGYDYRIDEQIYVGGGVDIFPLNLILGAAYLGPYAAYLSIMPSIHIGFYLY